MKTLKLSATAAIAAATVSVSTPAHAQSGTQFIGQVSAFGGNFCPRSWAEASGQLLPISQNTALFAIIGTTYGGDGRTTLALPDLRGRRPVSQGNGPGIGNYPIGGRGGAPSFTLVAANLPSHAHTGTVAASPGPADTNQPVRNGFAQSTGTNAYLDGDPAVNNMHPDTVRINSTGGNVAVNKVSPFQTVRWCIALNGIFPSRN
ncbi:tail fiber protein [Erythrobacter sp. F6033]|uniref:phage tail protein n=1 Tax=Erythrobacter sp. F6033 TaxID=2926401 RepID=UPI001FF1FA6B|nr:tail fiber protein [Erythrobacter sp. F6033]MCK0127773.1 tail fiber protein [Erythrobacter sp. F6033]